VSDIVRIYFDAFGRGIMNRLMYPGGVTAENRAVYASILPAKIASQKTEKSENDPSPKKLPVETFVMLAELLPEGHEKEASEAAAAAAKAEVIAVSVWAVYREPRPEHEWNVQRPMTIEEFGPGADLVFVEEFLGRLKEMKKWMKGDPGASKFGVDVHAF
jgi:hypothetical protein